MAMMKDPAKGLGKRISWIDNTIDVTQKDEFFVFPTLDCKFLNVNMPAMLSGNTVVDHVDSRHFVFIAESG